MALISWEYIAGFFDGEGSIGVTSGTGRIAGKISLHQSRPRGLRVLTEIQEFLLDRGITARIHSKEYATLNGPQSMHRLYIYRRGDELQFLEGVLPYLRIKKVECQDIYRWMLMYPPIASSNYHTGFRKASVLPPERLVCSSGHPLEPSNVYFVKHYSMRRPLWKACRQCCLDRRRHQYETVIKPIMTAYGMGMREVTKPVIEKARLEGVIA